MQRRRRLVGAGLVSLAALTLVLSAAITWFDRPEQLRAPRVAVPQLPDGDALAPVTLSPDDAVFARPLFWQERKPVMPADEVVVAEQPASVPAVDNIKLLGVLTADETRSAFLEVDGKPQRVQEGDAVSGWMVRQVLSQTVILEAGTERAELAVVRPVSPAIRLGNPELVK